MTTFKQWELNEYQCCVLGEFYTLIDAPRNRKKRFLQCSHFRVNARQASGVDNIDHCTWCSALMWHGSMNLFLLNTATDFNMYFTDCVSHQLVSRVCWDVASGS